MKMKNRNFVLGFAFLAAVTATQVRAAQEFENAGVISSDLTSGKMDPKLERLFTGTGKIQIDLARKQVRLLLDRFMRCPPNAMCSQIMPDQFELILPLVDHQTIGCNVELFIARTPVNKPGFSQEIQIRDLSRHHCIDSRYLAPILVEYRTFGAPSETTLSRLSGSRGLDRIR